MNQKGLLSNYELIWILAGSAPRSAVDDSIKKVNALIKSESGKVERAFFWEQRSLAYQIDKNDTGNYCIANFSIAGDKISNINDTLRIDSSILRYLVTKKEESGTA